LLKPGHWFSRSWRRAEQEVASIGAFVYQDKLVLSYRSKSGGEWEGVKEPVSLEWTPCNLGGAALVRLPWCDQRGSLQP
jgi:hypothetical protein